MAAVQMEGVVHPQEEEVALQGQGGADQLQEATMEDVTVTAELHYQKAGADHQVADAGAKKVVLLRTGEIFIDPADKNRAPALFFLFINF